MVQSQTTMQELKSMLSEMRELLHKQVMCSLSALVSLFLIHGKGGNSELL